MKFKNILLILVLVFAVSFVSCKRSPDKMIVKTWKVTNVVTKGVYDDSLFKVIKADLMRAEITFKDNKYTMSLDGNIIESGTYGLENKMLVVKTNEGIPMKAIVTKDVLTLETTDFVTTLQPK
jgi:hypothetical protein